MTVSQRQQGKLPCQLKYLRLPHHRILSVIQLSFNALSAHPPAEAQAGAGSAWGKCYGCQQDPLVLTATAWPAAEHISFVL